MGTFLHTFCYRLWRAHKDATDCVVILFIRLSGIFFRLRPRLEATYEIHPTLFASSNHTFSAWASVLKFAVAFCCWVQARICYWAMSAPHTRLKRLLSELSPSTSGSPQSIGTLELGGVSYDVPASLDPARLPHCSASTYLDVRDGFNYVGLHFMLQKFLLGQDIFLLSQPGPYARRLAMTFCRWVEMPARRFLCTDPVQND